MQNSGLGNAINLLISIAHKVYSIPLLLQLDNGSQNIKVNLNTWSKQNNKEVIKIVKYKFCVLEKKRI